MIIQPNILTNYIYRYHTRITGVDAKTHTSQYITDVLQAVYGRKDERLIILSVLNILLEERKVLPNADSFDIYEVRLPCFDYIDGGISSLTRKLLRN